MRIPSEKQAGRRHRETARSNKAISSEHTWARIFQTHLNVDHEHDALKVRERHSKGVKVGEHVRGAIPELERDDGAEPP